MPPHRAHRAVSALHDLPAIAHHLTGMTLLAHALGNAALPQYYATVASLTRHDHTAVAVAAVRALRRFPTRQTTSILTALLPPPPSFSTLFAVAVENPSHHGEVRQAALGVVARQRSPSPTLLRALLDTHVPAFDDLHGGDKLGCLDRCWAGCAPSDADGGLSTAQTPGLVTHSCREQCTRVCFEAIAYQSAVLDALHVHVHGPFAGQLGLGHSDREVVAAGHARLRALLFTLPEVTGAVGVWGQLCCP